MATKAKKTAAQKKVEALTSQVENLTNELDYAHKHAAISEKSHLEGIQAYNSQFKKMQELEQRTREAEMVKRLTVQSLNELQEDFDNIEEQLIDANRMLDALGIPQTVVEADKYKHYTMAQRLTLLIARK